ncbi:hypothetical protein ACO9S2_05890 [Nitrospira sp. NS4]|uniref:hypothetical protein n=1 Tax=Nitrospira sp. NS4 TaxID=3414498 RepID=UPI003C2ABD20
MAFHRFLAVALLLITGVLGGCAQHPLSRMDGYLGSAGQGLRDGVALQADRKGGPFNAGLLLVNDTSAQRSAPALSEKATAFLDHQVRERVERATPIRLVQVLTVGEPSRPQDPGALAGLARERGCTHVVVALFSSEESEVPTYLPVTGDPEQGGGRPGVPGYEAVNYALAELALIDAASGQVVARSEGRAWARLNRLNVPINSNAYPVIHRSQRVAPIYPPEADAKDILRSIAGDEALEQAVAKLQEAWSKS